MHCNPAKFLRLLLIACLALVQMFAPLVHAHTGDSRQAGVHMHLPAADANGNAPALSTDPGIEIGIETMRRESGGITPEPDAPPVLVSLSGTPALTAPDAPCVAPAVHAGENRIPAPNPPRGPPAAALR